MHFIDGTFAHLTVVAKATCIVNLCHTQNGQLIAVKAFPRHRANPDYIRRERDALKSMSHPLVVKFIRTAKDEKHVYIVMEAVVAGGLHRHIKHAGRLRVNTALFYAAQAAQAIEYVHSHKIIHRDVKASNILLDSSGKIRIVDFGAAALVDADAEVVFHTYCGTPHCMAPEMILRCGHSYAVDWWALGVVFVEMLIGEPPFWDEDEGKLHSQVLGGFDSRLLSSCDVDSSTREVIRTLLTSDPLDRHRAKSLHSGFGLVRSEDWPSVVTATPPDFCRDVGYLDWVEDTSDISPELDAHFNDF